MGLQPGSERLEQRRMALRKVVDVGGWEGLHVRQSDTDGECLAVSWIPNDPKNPLVETIAKVELLQAAAISYYGYSRTLKKRGRDRR